MVAVDSDAIRCDAVRCDVIRYDTMRSDAMQYDTTRCGTIRHGTTRSDSLQLDGIRHDTVRYDALLVSNMMQYEATHVKIERGQQVYLEFKRIASWVGDVQRHREDVFPEIDLVAKAAMPGKHQSQKGGSEGGWEESQYG